MARYLSRRLLSGLLILFLFVSMLFFAVELLSPGDYVTQYYWMSAEDKALLRESLGLDLPLGQRYLHWLSNLARGDLGHTYTPMGLGMPILDLIKALIPSTMIVFGLGTVLAFLIGQWLGKLVAWHRSGPIASGSTLMSVLLYTSFPPWLAFLLSYLAIQKIGILPQVFSTRLWRTAPMSEAQVIMQMLLRLGIIVAVLLVVNAILYRAKRRHIPIGLFVVLSAALWAGTWYVSDWWPYALDVAQRFALPLVAFTLLSFGEIMLIMRTSMEDTLHEEYIHAARAKGVPPRQIRNRHAARNALLPVMTRLVTSIPYLLTGMVMIEGAVSWHGIGTAMFDAFLQENMPIVVGVSLLIGVVSLVARLFLDVLVAVLDPRVRTA